MKKSRTPNQNKVTSFAQNKKGEETKNASAAIRKGGAGLGQTCVKFCPDGRVDRTLT